MSIKSYIEEIAREVFWAETKTYNRSVQDMARRAAAEQRDYVGDVAIQLDPGAVMPRRAHSTDAGADLFCKKDMEDVTIAPGDSALIDTGVHVQLPPKTVGMLKSKSGLNCLQCVQTEGVIDEGYSGAIKVRVYNHGEFPKTLKALSAVTQLVIMPVFYPGFYQVDEVEGGERGSAGFGSTGK